MLLSSAELRVDLLAEILFVAHEFGQRRVLVDAAGAGRRERLLHRAAADRIRQRESVGSDVAARGLRIRQQPDIGFDDGLQPLAARRRRPSHRRRRCSRARRQQNRDRRLELADGIGVLPARISPTASIPRAEAVSKCFSPTRAISRFSSACAASSPASICPEANKRVDARAVQLEHLARAAAPTSRSPCRARHRR